MEEVQRDKRESENRTIMPTTKRNCYCREGQKHCGKCDICGKPGHVSHHPGGVPFTGAWCTFHYEELAKKNVVG